MQEDLIGSNTDKAPPNLTQFLLGWLVDNEHEGSFDAPSRPWQDVAGPGVARVHLLKVLAISITKHFATSELHHLLHHCVVEHAKQKWILCQGSSQLQIKNVDLQQ